MVELEVDTYKDNGELDRTNKISHPITIINSWVHQMGINNSEGKEVDVCKAYLDIDPSWIFPHKMLSLVSTMNAHWHQPW